MRERNPRHVWLAEGGAAARPARWAALNGAGLSVTAQ